jgi:GDPmannose 4,6-dehydratase
MKAIIFGANGQDGYYLRKIIEKCQMQVIGVSRSIVDGVTGDVADYKFVESLVKHHQPHFIFHFAANSTTKHEALFENHQTISTGTLNILESVFLHSRKTKVFISGSGLQFTNRGFPIDELETFEARDAYSIARIQSAYAARYYRSLGLQVFIGYFFNHDSAFRSERHINQKIASYANRIAKGSKDVLEIGDVSVRKEFTFAGDSMRAVWRLINNNDGVAEAVVGSGKAYSIADWLTICFQSKGLNWKDHVSVKEGFKSDYNILVSNPQTIQSLGWQQTVEIEQLAHMMLNQIIDAAETV